MPKNALEALKVNLPNTEIRESDPPESTTRETNRKVHTPDPAYDFYDELTEPLWSPPILHPEPALEVSKPSSAEVNPNAKIEPAPPAEAPPIQTTESPDQKNQGSSADELPSPQLPIISVWEWFLMALSGS